MGLEYTIKKGKISPKKNNKNILKEISQKYKNSQVALYKFLDNFYLAAIVKNNGTQKLGIFYKDNNKINSHYIECIHTAIGQINANELQNLSEEEKINLINARSSENQIINLSLEEKFKAFKSWVAGIAEAGEEAFYIQSEIENAANLAYPITQPLMKFVAKHDKKILEDYVNHIFKSCRFENSLHQNSLIANLTTIKYVEGALDYVLSGAEENAWGAIVEAFEKQAVAGNPKATRFEGYKQLFDDEDLGVVISALRNQNAKDIIPKKKESFYKFILENDIKDKIDFAVNPEATKFEEYRQLFNDENCIVRKAVAGNPNAVKFEEFGKLFDDEDWEVRRAVAGNPNAPLYFKKEFRKLFNDDNGFVLENIYFNPNAVKFEEYKGLIKKNIFNIVSEQIFTELEMLFKKYLNL